MRVPAPGTRAHEHWVARQNRQPLWYEAPIPRRWHRCKPFTTGHQFSQLGHAGNVARCACGSISFAGGPWLDRNSRRRAK